MWCGLRGDAVSVLCALGIWGRNLYGADPMAIGRAKMQSWCSKAMKRGLMAIGFAVLAVSWALAQQKKSVLPPPKPADEGPSLEVTMKFIQDKLNDVGAVNYATYTHDNAAGNDWTNQFRVEAT